MSIMRCEKHDRSWDSDKMEECPICENEPSLDAPNSPRIPVLYCNDYGWIMLGEGGEKFEIAAKNSPLGLAMSALFAGKAPPSETVPPKKGWPWKEGEVSIPAHILQQCEVWIGTAAHAGIQTKWFDGTDTPNRTQLLALHSALLALLNEPAAAAPSSTRPSHEDEDDFILRIAREVGMDPKPFTLTRWKDGIDIEYVIEHMKAFVRRVRAARSAMGTSAVSKDDLLRAAIACEQIWAMDLGERLREAADKCVCVPMEPTDEMCTAGTTAYYKAQKAGDHITSAVYRAMLAAAPGDTK